MVIYGAGFALIVYQFEHGAYDPDSLPGPGRVRDSAGLALTTVFNSTGVFVVVFTSMAVAIGCP